MGGVTLYPNRKKTFTIVNPNGGGDFVSISAAIASGAKSLFLRNGTYNEAASITLPEGVVIEGESAEGVIIRFASSAGFVLDNTTVRETAGTISITNNTTAVVGVGTTFTNLAAGQYINLAGKFYEIAEITDDTNLDIVETYLGATLSGVNFVAQAMYGSCDLRNFTIDTVNSGISINLRRIKRIALSNIRIISSRGIQIRECEIVTVEYCEIDSTTNSGIVANNNYLLSVCKSLIANSTGDNINVFTPEFGISSIKDVNSFNSSGDGVSVAGSGISLIHGVQCVANSIGINFSSPKKVILSDFESSRNTLHGIFMSCTDTTFVIDGGILDSNANTGILVGGTGACAHSKITNCVLRNNATSGITLAGTLSSYSKILVKNNSVEGGTTPYNLNDLATEAFSDHEEYQIEARIADPTVTGTNLAGLLRVPFKSRIIDVIIALDNRGDDGDTVVDINRHTPTLVQGTQVNNTSGTTIYTSATKPTLAGATATPTQNAIIHAATPDTRNLNRNDFLSVDIDTATTNSVGLYVCVRLKRIPE